MHYNNLLLQTCKFSKPIYIGNAVILLKGDWVADGSKDISSVLYRKVPPKRASSAGTLFRSLGEKMNGMANALGLLLKGRNVVVWSDDGVMQGKAYCRESEVADYIRSMMKFSNSRLQVVIQKE